MKKWMLTAIVGFTMQAQALTIGADEIFGKTDLARTKIVDLEGRPTMVLGDVRGMSVYTFDLDKRDESVCKGGCLTVWPPVEVPVGSKVEQPFGMIVGNNGKPQLTLDGLPLYYFFRDKTSADTAGHYPDWQLVIIE